MENRFLGLIENSIKEHWDLPAFSDYNGHTFHYKDVARRIEKFHIILEHAGIKKGDKVALVGRNSSNWAICFFGILAYGAVAVPILHEFKPDNIHHIVNHSEAKAVLAASSNWENMNERMMPDVKLFMMLDNFSIIHSKSKEVRVVRDRINEYFGKKYPRSFTSNDVRYHVEKPEELAVLNYTSGTTSFSKGVMLPYRSLWSNLTFAFGVFGKLPGEQVISMLPMAHMYGLAFEFIYEFASGAHVFFLTRTPSPKIIADAFSTVRPNLIISVPLIIEKIIRKYQKGEILSIRFLLDPRVKVCKAKPLQMLSATFSHKILRVHAKVVTIENEVWKISVVSSQNATTNPKLERGVIFISDEIFNFDKTVFEHEFNTARTGNNRETGRTVLHPQTDCNNSGNRSGNVRSTYPLRNWKYI